MSHKAAQDLMSDKDAQKAHKHWRYFDAPIILNLFVFCVPLCGRG